jgi:hypothetical protein
MAMNLTAEEIKNILALMNRANITGQEALTVAGLQTKLQAMLRVVTAPLETPAPTGEKGE